MIRKLRTQRDNQQWIFDLALNMRGRVQNFERDDTETPRRAHNYSLDAHEYVLDWLGTVLGGPGLPADHARIAYVSQQGDGPFGDCEWTPPVGPGQAYF